MNFLAHFHTAGDEPDLIQGALLGDFIKGPLRGDYRPGSERGIALHRSIDSLSDSDQDPARARSTLPDELRQHRHRCRVDDLLRQHWLDFHADGIGRRLQRGYPLRNDTAASAIALEPLRGEAFLNFYPRAQHHAASFLRWQ